MPDEPLDPEDAKLVTLARATRARTSAHSAAAVRDTTGRTYAAAAVSLPSLELSALQAAVVVALGSGASGLEAAAVLADHPSVDEISLSAVRELAGSGVPVVLADAAGEVQGTVRS